MSRAAFVELCIPCSSPPLPSGICPSLSKPYFFSYELWLRISLFGLSIFIPLSKSLKLYSLFCAVTWAYVLCSSAFMSLYLSSGPQVKPPSFPLLSCYRSSCLSCRSLLLFLFLCLFQSVRLTVTHAQCFHTYMHTYTLSLSVPLKAQFNSCYWAFYHIKWSSSEDKVFSWF